MNKLLITGGTGLIGSFLSKKWNSVDINILTRNPRQSHDNVTYYKWDLDEMYIDSQAFDGVSHVLCLAGAGIADKRWTQKRKKELIDSRVIGNTLLSQELEKAEIKIQSIVCASAIGYYGNRGEEILTEDSGAGQDEFLVECSKRWEDSSHLLEDKADRFSIMRIGIVLSTQGGALEKMLMPLRLGVSGYFGNGEQYYSWIHIEDLVGLIHESLYSENYTGIFNGVCKATQLRDFAKEIKNIYSPIAFAMPIPSFALSLGMGEMTSMLTNSTRVIPQRAKELGFEFRYSSLKEAVEDLVERKI